MVPFSSRETSREATPTRKRDLRENKKRIARARERERERAERHLEFPLDLAPLDLAKKEKKKNDPFLPVRFQPTKTKPNTTMVDLDAAFAAVNTSKTGKITAAEVQAALALANLPFSLQTCALAVRLHDVDDDGCITRGEFEALHSSLDGLNAAFGELSGAGPGAADDAPGLDLDKTEAALSKVGIDLDRPAPAAAFAAFDPSKDGTLCASEFIGLALFLRAAKAAFRAFDSVRGCVLFFRGGGGGGGGRERSRERSMKTQ